MGLTARVCTGPVCAPDPCAQDPSAEGVQGQRAQRGDGRATLKPGAATALHEEKAKLDPWLHGSQNRRREGEQGHLGELGARQGFLSAARERLISD